MSLLKSIIMKITSPKFRFFILSVGLTLVLLNSCLSAKTYQGTVLSTEQGKDGYTAYLVNKKGEKFDALFSIPRMEGNFRLLKAGEEVKLEGDTIHLDHRIRVLVKKIR